MSVHTYAFELPCSAGVTAALAQVPTTSIGAGSGGTILEDTCVYHTVIGAT